jgi:hypothetical protein
MNFPELAQKPVNEAKIPEKLAEDCSTAEGILAKTRCRMDKFFAKFESTNSRNELKSQLRQTPESLRHLDQSRIPKDLFEVWNAQKEIAKYPHKKKDDDVIALIQAPDGTRHHIAFKQSFKEENKTLYVTVAGKQLKLFSEKTNGYNTEYVITDADGKRWKSLAILYTSTNPDYREQQNKVQKLQSSLAKLKDEEEGLKAELQLIAKKLKAKKLDKKTKEGLKDRADSIAKKSPEIAALKKQLKADIGQEERKLQAIEPKVHFPYTPYAKIYESPETTAIWFHYLNNSVREAWGTPELKRLNSRLGRNSDMPTTMAIPAEIAIVLNIVERMSFQEYFRTVVREKTVKLPRKKGQKKDQYATVKERVTELRPMNELRKLMDSQIEKALATFSLNLENSYAWQRSWVWALGIAQIMPSTHGLFQRKFPEILKNPKFERAAMNHGESFRFQALHLTDEGKQLPPQSIQRNWEAIMSDPNAKVWLYGVLAAGYNGSMSRIKSEALSEAKNPLEPEKIRKLLHPDALMQRTAGNDETMTYVLKFKHVWEYLSRRFPESFDAQKPDFHPQLIAYNMPNPYRK